MKQSKHNPEPLVLQEGYFLDKYYSNYEMLVVSTKNWKYNCMYQLKPNALSGHHRILQLSAMQLGYVTRPGGTMHDTYSALDCISVAVIEKCADKACFHRMKLEVGDIIFFDNSHPYRFVTNDSISFIIMNIKINILAGLQSKISQAFDHKIKDTHGVFATLLNETWEQFTNVSEHKRDKNSYKEAEKKILSLLETLLDKQDPETSKLTKGEKIALTIRDQLYAHMDGKISISSLAKQYNVTEGTLQNSFKSLFGFTPKNFLRQMKLNLVYRDLQKAEIKDETVSNVALRWGFMHMGHFSNYYRKLFGENPSTTLKTPYLYKNAIAGECVERQEEVL